MATHKAMRLAFAAICAATPLFTAYGGDLRVMIGTKAGNSRLCHFVFPKEPFEPMFTRVA